MSYAYVLYSVSKGTYEIHRDGQEKLFVLLLHIGHGLVDILTIVFVSPVVERDKSKIQGQVNIYKSKQTKGVQ